MNRFVKLTAWMLMAVGLLTGTQALADGISDDVVRIGVVTDMSGALADLSGTGSETAVRMAVDDFGGKVLGKRIEVVAMDHQNKADVASSRVRAWFDQQKVDMVTDLTNSAVALAAIAIAKDMNRIAIVNGAGTTRITNDSCSPLAVHWAWDTYAMANGTDLPPVDVPIKSGSPGSRLLDGYLG